MAFYAGPSFRRAQNHHRPGRFLQRLPTAGGLLNQPYLGIGIVHSLSEYSVSLYCLDNVIMIAKATEQKGQFSIIHRPIDRRITNFVAIEMQNWEHGSRFRRVDEFVAMPGGSGWT